MEWVKSLRYKYSFFLLFTFYFCLVVLAGQAGYVSKFHDQMSGKTSQNTGGAYDVSQTVVSQMPQIGNVNGLEALVFSGTQQLFGLVNVGSPFTVIAVCRITGNSGGAFVQNGDSTVGVAVGIGNGSFDNVGGNFLGLNDYIGWVTPNVALPVGVPFIVEMNAANDNTTNFLLNGAIMGNRGSYNESGGHFYLGSDGNFRYATFDLYEVITFNDIISPGERNTILASMYQAYCEVLLIQCSATSVITDAVYDASNQILFICKL